MSTIEELKAKIKTLEQQLNEKNVEKNIQSRQKIEQMSSEVIDTNPYR